MGKREPKILAMVLIETLAAQVMTLPIILFIFGRLSIISVFANILIVPLVPLAMMLSFLAGLGGMLLPSLAGWVAWPTTLLMTYMLDIVRLLSALPHASINYKINALQLVIVYILILAVLLIWWHKIAPSVKIKKLKPRLARAKQIL
jgi:competence protein ComEC